MSCKRGFELLPPELLITIAKHLSKLELKALRLLTRLSKSIAESLLFGTATFSLQPRRQEQFSAICNHPVYRFHVKKVNYSVTTVHLKDDAILNSLLIASGHVDKWQERRQLRADFTKLCTKIEDTPVKHIIHILRTGFQRLPNLTSIAFVQDSFDRSGWFTEFPWLATAYHQLPYPDANSTMIWEETKPGKSINMQRGILPPTPTFYLRDCTKIIQNHVHWQDFYAVMHAVTLAGSHIEEFSVYDELLDGTAHSYRSPNLAFFWSHMEADYVVPRKVFFANLTKLSLYLGSCYPGGNRLSSLLLVAQSLEELKIDSGIHDPLVCITESYDCLKHAFTVSATRAQSNAGAQVITLPKLRVVSISNSMLCSATLRAFLARHKGIESLSLHNIFNSRLEASLSVIEAHWDDILEIIKLMGLKVLTLKNVSGLIRALDPAFPVERGVVADSTTTIVSVDNLMERIWSAMGICLGRMPAELRGAQHRYAKLNFNWWQATRSSRLHVKRDKVEMEKLIKLFITGQTNVNPLIGLRMHKEVNWVEDKIFGQVLGLEE